MQTQKMLYTLGLTSLGIVAPCGVTLAAVGEVNSITEFQVATQDNGTRIIITGTQPFTPEISNYGMKGATIITVPGIWNAGKSGIRTVGKNGVAFIRCGQYSTQPSKRVRVVANHVRGLDKALTFELTPSADQTRWEILLTPAETAGASVASVDSGSRPARLPVPHFSVDTKALMAAARKVASTRPLVPASPTPRSAPRISLSTLLTISAKQKPLALITPPRDTRLKPYPTRSAVPPKTVSVASVKELMLPPLPKKTQAPQLSEAAPLVVAAPLVEAAPTPRPSEPAKIQENPLDRIVSVDFVNAELAEVLKLVSLQAKVNQVSGQGVNGKKVTLSLQKVLLRDALDWITRTSGLAYTVEGNTVIVGTGQEIAQLKRTAQTSEAASATIPFFYADAESLKAALIASFPNVSINVIKASSDSQQAKQSEVASQGSAPPQGGTPPSIAPPSQGGASGQTGSSTTETSRQYVPRGGAIYVVGTNQIIVEITKTIRDVEEGLIRMAQSDAEASATRMRSYTNDVYEVKYVDPMQAASLVRERIPTLIVRPGPMQRFIANSVGTTSAFSGPGAGGTGSVGASSVPPSGSATGGSVPQQGPSGGGGIESRILLLTGSSEDVTRAKEMLTRLDVRVPQLIYEARIVEVNKNTADQLGLKYDLGRAITIGENDLGGPANTTLSGVPGGRKLNGGTLFRTPYSVSAQIDALATQGKANILARPTLSALDGNSATTFIGDQIPYIISQSISPTGGLNIQTGIANAGIKLQVSGRSNGDGTMTVYVHPEISTITQFVGTLPQISTRFVDTTIRVKDGQTIAIGGLVRRQDIDNMRKVPGLGDLPVLGQLFRSSDKRTQESEVLIFITCSLAKD